MRADGKKFIWYDEVGLGRNLYCEFLKVFNIDNKVPQTANFHLFADTVYELKINNKFVGFGPVRFDPRFPQFDTYDIAKHLHVGENKIEVIVNSFGTKTYKAMPSIGSFCAWGNVGDINLATSNGGWKARPSKSHQSYMHKMSFALNPIEIVVEQAEENPWLPAVDLKDQDHWGTFEPRSIPFMSLAERSLNINDAKILPINNDFTIHGFEVPLPDFASDNQNDYSFKIFFKTWIWSPKAQDIVANAFWGEVWLNGKELTDGVEDTTRNMKINHLWHLKEGWNYLFGSVRGYNDYLCQLFAVPSEAGLVFSAEKDLDCPHNFKHTLSQEITKFDSALAKIKLPFDPAEELEAAGGWSLFSKGAPLNAPCRFSSLDNYGAIFQNFDAGANSFSKNLYPQGFALLFDLCHTDLVFPRIKMSGVAGATIDFSYSEVMLDDKLHLETVFNYQSCDRLVCMNDRVEFQPMQPRGMRYLMITVRNADSDVVLESLKIIDAKYPVKNIGSFECSDELLNQVWHQCQLTQATNMEDAYVDCVSRERGMYVRDTVIQYFNNMSVYGDEALMERCMQLYGQSPEEEGRFRAVYPNSGNYMITDFCLNAIEGYYALYKFSGKTESFARDWEAMKTNLAWFDALADEREDKLLDANWDKKRKQFSQYGGFHGDLIGKGPRQFDNDGIHCVFSCTYIIALENMAEMALALGKNDEARQLNERAQVVRSSIRQKLFDGNVGLYKDSLNSEFHSFHAQVFVIRAKVATPEQLATIKAHLAKNFDSVFLNGYNPDAGIRFSPSFGFYILDGLYKADLPELAENLIRSSWGYFLHAGYTQCPEYHVIGPGISYCHAWSAAPLYFLSAEMAGIEFAEDSKLNRYKLNVKASTVDWAKIKLPHPKGTIEIAWHMEDGVRIFDKIAAPPGVEIIK
ncbi:MAG: family 78 glycoside hydrolase catalytic domain [Bacillota bacterium]